MIFGDDKSDNDDNDDDKDVGKRGQTVLVCNNTWGDTAADMAELLIR